MLKKSLVALVFAVGCGGAGDRDNRRTPNLEQLAGTYSGTWQSGESTGTAELVIHSDGLVSGTLEDHQFNEKGQVVSGEVVAGGTIQFTVYYPGVDITRTLGGRLELQPSGGLAGILQRNAGDVNISYLFALERVE